ncbi:MAG: rhodanese-like domain-containing protein [Candidatus Riflebacteria bacterium]|nr:rhodanese-like domain-containing protein [Candidatus Riflebacteria bacterium]
MSNRIWRPVFLVFFVTVLCVTLMGASIVYSESASHGDEAAKYQIQSVYEGTDVKIVQFKLGVLSHYSYLMISDGKVLAVDPGRDIDAYINYASGEKLEWVGTFLTHSHADFIAGHTEMAHATGKPVYVSHKSDSEYAHMELAENDIITVGKAFLRIIETPGHTPDSLCGIVGPLSKPEKQEFLFSGDTLFVGSLGRPDLMGGVLPPALLASMMFDTWNNKLAKLAGNVVILPAHGAGSLCGANLRDEPSSTIAQEQKTNYYLKYVNNKSAFISKILSDLEPAPAYFKENARINRVGPEKVDWSNLKGRKITALPPVTDNTYIIDVRDAVAYAEKHILASVNIGLNGRFESWTGTIVPFGSHLIIVGSMSEIEIAASRLKRVGYSADYLVFDEYVAAGGEIKSSVLISPSDLYTLMQHGNAPIIVDVRRRNEWLGMKIGEVINIPLDVIEKQAGMLLNLNEEVVAVCNSAFRSSLAIGLLERAGFKKVSSMSGGADAWIAAGLPVVRINEDAKTTAVAAAPSYRHLGLPERISAKQLQQMIKDLPDTFEILDIRPAEQVQDYNPTGAKAVDLAELLESHKWLAGDVPLVIVDRDGTLAMMVAGILSRKTERPIKALLGGIESYWRETEMGPVRDRILAPSVQPLNSPVKQLNQPVMPAKPVKKGAGC